MPLAGASMCAEEGAGWGFTVIQVLPGSLRDLVTQAAVSDHFQLGLHFAPSVPRHPQGTVLGGSSSKSTQVGGGGGIRMSVHMVTLSP